MVGPEKALAEAETMERGGVKLTPFNSLAFNYRGALRCLYIIYIMHDFDLRIYFDMIFFMHRLIISFVLYRIISTYTQPYNTN